VVNVDSLTRRFEQVFERRQASVLAEAINDAYSQLVKTSDFNELKAIMARLAIAQERTEARLEQLALSQDRLTAAQERTEARLERLALAQERTDASLERLSLAQERTEARLEQLAVAQDRTDVSLERLSSAQERTEARLEQLAVAQENTEKSLSKLALTVDNLSRQLGGLSRGMGYALENESYRNLPAYLQANEGITLSERIIRTEIDGVEINVLVRGERNGRPIVVVGESKLQMDERRDNQREAYRIFDQLDRQAQVVQQVYPNHEVVRLLITHYARPSFVKLARERGVVVVQSFEW
jgi:hypothetical protein